MTLDDLQHLLGVWQVRLGLANWEIILKADDGSMDIEDSYFEIYRHETAHRAHVWVKKWVIGEEEQPEDLKDELTEEFIERGLVHELCHVIFRDHNTLVREYVPFHLGHQAWSALSHALDLAEEGAVDDLARALVANWGSDTPGSRKATIWGREDRPIEHEWLCQELDDSVQIIPLHEPGHFLGTPPDECDIGKQCWCEPEIEHVNGIPKVTHRDFLHRATGETK